MSEGLRLVLVLDEALIQAFATMTGDFSPTHMDAEFARTGRYRARVAHGMAPVTAALIVLGSRFPGVRLRRLSCRFLKPLKLDERVEVALDGALGDVHMQVFDSAGDCATQGSAVLEPGRPADEREDDALREVIAAASLTLSDLTEGQGAEVTAAGSRAGVRVFLDVLSASAPEVRTDVPVDPNLMAVASSSTLVGMRLPGRLATFLDLDAVLDEDVQPDAVLVGQVERISRGSGRLGLHLEWRQDGRTVGAGSAGVLVNVAPPAEMDMDQIRAEGLGPGLEGKVVLVTGASRGIGAATVRLAAAYGAKTAVHYFRGAKAADAVVGDIRSHGGTAIAVGADLADAEAVAAMFDLIEGELGGVDVLVNNAVGAFTPKPFDKVVAGDFLDEIGVSLTGMHACCVRAVPHMRRRKWGRIVNLGTIATETPPSGQAVYASVKSALTGYTRSLAAELARDNIQVNLVVPRMTDTTLLASLPAGLVERLAEDSPAGRLLSPIEVARAIVFLMSNAAAPISGQRLVLGQGEAPFL